MAHLFGVAGPRPDGPGSTLMVLALGLGVGGVLLALFGLSVIGAALGLRLPGLVPALDPAVPGSLPELWGAAQLALAAAAAAAARGRRASALRLTALPLVLLLADGTDLAAHFANRLAASEGGHWSPFAAKLVATSFLGLLVAVPGWLAWLDLQAADRSIGRGLLVGLVLGLALSAGLDLLGGSVVAPAAAHLLAMAEECVELTLYSSVAALVIGRVIETSRLVSL